MNGKPVYVEKGDVIIGKVLTKSNKNGEEELIDNSYVIKSGEEGYIEGKEVHQSSVCVVCDSFLARHSHL